MTTSKPYHGRDAPVAFKRPTVGPRVYIIESSAGWSETHNRKQADEALTKFLAPLVVAKVLHEFQIAMQLEGGDPETWEDVLGFLGEITGQPAKLIPEIVAVSFWGQLTVLDHQQGTN